MLAPYANNKQYQAELFAGGQNVFTGSLRLDKASATSYDVRLYEKDADFAQKVEGKSLRDLASLGTAKYYGSQNYGDTGNPLYTYDWYVTQRPQSGIKIK
jgi:hypothetical protein